MSKKKTKYTKAQKKAYHMGKGYAAGKSGAVIPFGEKNKSSFLNGYKKGKDLTSKYDNALSKKG